MRQESKTLEAYIFSDKIDRMIDKSGGWLMGFAVLYFAGQILRMVF